MDDYNGFWVDATEEGNITKWTWVWTNLLDAGNGTGCDSRFEYFQSGDLVTNELVFGTWAHLISGDGFGRGHPGGNNTGDGSGAFQLENFREG